MTSQSQYNNLATEIVIAKTAAASSTAKVTKLLTEVQSLKTSNVGLTQTIKDLSDQVIHINTLVNSLDISFNLDASYVSDASFEELVSRVDNLDASFILDASFVTHTAFDLSFVDAYSKAEADASFVTRDAFDLSFVDAYSKADADASFVTHIQLDESFNSYHLKFTSDELIVTHDISLNKDLYLGGELRGPSVFYIDPRTYGEGDTSGLVIIRGDLQVDGTKTIINSSIVDISDKVILLGSNATHISQLDEAGIEISGNTLLFRTDGNDNRWETNISLSVSGELKVEGTNVLTEINALKSNVSSLDSSFVLRSAFDSSLDDVYTKSAVDASFASLVTDIGDLSSQINLDVLNIDNKFTNNVGFLSNQDVLIKNDIIFNNSLIDNNFTGLNVLQNKFNNLINLLNSQLNLNINPNLL